MRSHDHQKAQELASEAMLLKRTDGERARALYKSAAAFEEKALNAVPKGADRTRGILSVSFASMLYKAREYALAERAICSLLADDRVPGGAKEELRELLEVVWDERVIYSGGAVYSGDEVLVALRRGQIGWGTAPLDAVIHNISGFNSLFYRVAELKGNYSFRSRGLPPAEVLEAVQARVTQPVAGSYKFTIRLLAPRQLEMFDQPRVVPQQVSASFIQMVEVAASGNAADFKELVPQEDYRNAMLKLIRNIVPAGKSVGEVELSRITGEGNDKKIESVILRPETKLAIANVIEALAPVSVKEAVVERGVLRALHLDRNWLEITLPSGSHLRFETKEDVLDDVVGPMVNRPVIVRGYKKARRSGALVLDDIEIDNSGPAKSTA